MTVDNIQTILAPAVEKVAKDGLTCPDCGQTYSATHGHCRGGRFGGCCKSWGTQRAHERHRIGNYDDGSRRCMTTEEMLAAGWAERDGRWFHPSAVKDWDRGHRMALPRLKAPAEGAGTEVTA